MIAPQHPRLRIWIIALIVLFSGITRAQPIQPLSERLDAIVSYPLVVSLRVENENDLRRGVTTRIDDGRSFTSQPFWVGLTPYQTLPTWTRVAGQWDAVPYEQIRSTPIAQRPTGSWFILVPLPIDAVGQGLWFGQMRYELNWLPDPERALLEADTVEHTRDFTQFWSMHPDASALMDPSVQKAVEQYHRDPFQNWRARLLTDGLDPDRTRARETHAQSINMTDSIELELATQSPGNDLLSAIARQQEARWQIILGRIWLIDPDTATRMKLALTRTARFGDRTLPLWNADNTDLSRLAHDLLSPYVDDDTRVLRAKAWLETQARAVAWIIDDQGTLEAGTDRFLPTLGVLSLPSEPGNSLLRIDAGLASPILETISPNTLQQIQIPLEPIEVSKLSPQIATTRIDLRLARWSQSNDLIASRVPAGAPFVRIGPLLADWTMGSLLNNRPLEHASISPDRMTSGILWRTITPNRSNPRAGWRLFFECAATNPGERPDALTVWIGPREYPTAAWRITPDALVETIARNGSMIVPQPSVETRILADRWIAQIDLPDIVFDQDGQLMLGIERTDADGVHSAWPRRMIPDQHEPGRLIITPDRFDDLRLP